MSVNPLDFISPDGIEFPLADHRHGVTRRIRFSVDKGGIYVLSNNNTSVVSMQYESETGYVFSTSIEGENIYTGFGVNDVNLNSTDLSITDTNTAHIDGIAGAWDSQVNEFSYEEWFEKEGYDVYHYIGGYNGFGLDINNVVGSKYIIGFVPQNIEVSAITTSDILLGYYVDSGAISLVSDGVVLQTVNRSDTATLKLGQWDYNNELSINDDWEYCNRMTIYTRGHDPWGALFQTHEEYSDKRYFAKNTKRVVYAYCPGSGLDGPYVGIDESYAFPVQAIPVSQFAWQNYVRTAEVNR